VRERDGKVKKEQKEVSAFWEQKSIHYLGFPGGPPPEY